MTVKFEFTMSDIDAENLVGAVRDSALRNDEYIMETLADEDLTPNQKTKYVEAFKAHREYTLGLIAQMTNTRVE